MTFPLPFKIPPNRGEKVSQWLFRFADANSIKFLTAIRFIKEKLTGMKNLYFIFGTLIDSQIKDYNLDNDIDFDHLFDKKCFILDCNHKSTTKRV